MDMIHMYLAEKRHEDTIKRTQEKSIHALVRHYANHFREEKRRNFSRPEPQK